VKSQCDDSINCADEILLGDRTIKDLYNEVQQVYLSDNRPWVIGYSGGKDSTATLQLVWYALSSLPKVKLRKPVYIISSDTMVETPVVADVIRDSLIKINSHSKATSLPFSAHLVKPDAKDSFWVNLIGRGYPIPSLLARWCTDRLKISPANSFILEKVAEYGEVLLVLGVRKQESATRAQVINLRTIKGSLLKRHSSLTGAFVYAPIVDFSVQDVWDYLIDIRSPWGDEQTNKDLFELYKSANAGECPLVIDNTTPSCGNSRFGCWVCTVVKKDHSMRSLVKSGEKWMEPLLKFRDVLQILSEPSMKPLYRDYRRRDGRVYFKKGKYANERDNGSQNDIQRELAWGQTRIDRGFGQSALEKFRDMGLEVRENDTGLPQILLRTLLCVQLNIQKVSSDTELISIDELEAIRSLWRNEQGDWQDSVPIIYREVFNRDINWAQDDVSGFSGIILSHFQPHISKFFKG